MVALDAVPSVAPPRTRLDLATRADDASLRQLLRETPMRGWVDLAFLREPDYFRAAAMLGETVQTIVARRGDAIVGVGTRALRESWINGTRTTAGYLADLRLRPEVRGTTLLLRGYQFLRELHADGRATAYSTVIVEDNVAALRSIASGRAGLPEYIDLGRIVTPMLHVGRRRPVEPGDVRAGTASEWPEIVAKLNENRAQFSPVYGVEDFRANGRYPEIAAEDFLVYRRGGEIVGVLAVWNQRAFRQTVALRYHFGVDVVAGLGLATLVVVSARFVRDDV